MVVVVLVSDIILILPGADIEISHAAPAVDDAGAVYARSFLIVMAVPDVEASLVVTNKLVPEIDTAVNPRVDQVLSATLLSVPKPSPPEIVITDPAGMVTEGLNTIWKKTFFAPKVLGNALTELSPDKTAAFAVVLRVRA